MIYIAGPITANNEFSIEANVKFATDIYFKLIKAGVDAICPHLGATHPIAFEIGYERWMEYDFVLIDLCSHVFMLPRWETSKGACREHEYAKKTGKIILYQMAELE